MSLQEKTFSWGSYSYGSESNAYVLELTLTENSTSVEGNTSSVDYTLVLKSGNQNRFQGDVTSSLKLNGVLVASKTENKYLDYNSTWTLLSGTTDVKHNSDGSLNMPIEVSIDTTDSNQYAPPDKTLNWSWELTKINLTSACTSPTSFSASPEVFDGAVELSWSGAKGGTNNAITGYEIQCAVSTDGGDTWGGWVSIWQDNQDNVSLSESYIAGRGVSLNRGDHIKFRIMTIGSAGSAYNSGWIESNVVSKDNEPYVYIDNGVSIERYLMHIDEGDKWTKLIPYRDNGTSWDRIS